MRPELAAVGFAETVLHKRWRVLPATCIDEEHTMPCLRWTRAFAQVTDRGRLRHRNKKQAFLPAPCSGRVMVASHGARGFAALPTLQFRSLAEARGWQALPKRRPGLTYPACRD